MQHVHAILDVSPAPIFRTHFLNFGSLNGERKRSRTLDLSEIGLSIAGMYIQRSINPPRCADRYCRFVCAGAGYAADGGDVGEQHVPPYAAGEILLLAAFQRSTWR